jgi:hypothetical protein
LPSSVAFSFSALAEPANATAAPSASVAKSALFMGLSLLTPDCGQLANSAVPTLFPDSDQTI